MKHINKKNLLLLGFLILLSIPSIFPLFHRGFFVTDDGEWMIIRLSSFYQTFADGQFPVRFLGRLNHEYGYPIATFLYPGFMYIGSIIHLFKIGFVDAVKIILGVSMVSSLIFSYFWLRKFFDKKSSLMGGVYYLYVPYHLYDLYKRGSVGEVLALAIIPFILWQIERKSIFFTSLGIGFLILSHNTLSLLFTLVIVSYMLLGFKISKSRRELYKNVTALGLGLGLSAFYWTPVVFELKNTIFSDTKISDWGGYFANTSLIGYSTILVIFFTLYILILKKVLIKKHLLTLLFLIIGIISIFFAAPISNTFWQILPAGLIQFPFRLLSITILSCAFLASFVASVLKGILKKMYIILMLVLIFVSTIQYITTVKYFDKGEGFYTTNNATTTVQDEYMPVWVKEKPIQRPGKKVEIVQGDGEIHDLVNTGKKTSFVAVISHADATIKINTIYWPGWKIYQNNELISFSYDNKQGVIYIDLTPGIWPMEMRFEETPSRLFSDIISVVSLVILIFVSKVGILHTKGKKL